MCQIDDVICVDLIPGGSAVCCCFLVVILLRELWFFPLFGIFLAHCVFVRSRSDGCPHGLVCWSHPTLVAKAVIDPFLSIATVTSVLHTLICFLA